MKKFLLIILFIFGIGFFCVILGPIFFPYQLTSIEALTWGREPNIIAVQPVVKDGKNGLVTVRLLDGKEQRFDGDWNIDFANADAFIYKKTNLAPHSVLYYIEQGRKVLTISIEKIAGDILSIKENPPGTYFVLEMELHKNRYYCVIEKIGEQKPSCKQLGVGAATRARWNPAAEHELIIQGAGEEIITFDPWVNKPITIDKNKDVKHYQELASLLTHVRDIRSIDAADGKKSFIQILSLVAIVHGSSINFLSVPLNSHIAWLNDGKHLLIKSPNELSIIEYQTKKKVVIPTYQKNSSVIVGVGDSDETL